MSYSFDGSKPDTPRRRSHLSRLGRLTRKARLNHVAFQGYVKASRKTLTVRPLRLDFDKSLAD